MRLPLGCALGLLAALALSTPVSGQKLWIVDVANGPGTHFTAIQPAIDAAAPGDTIQVTPPTGTQAYVAFTLNKGVNVVAKPGTTFPLLDFFGNSTTIAQIPAGAVARLSGCRASGPATINLSQCQGGVILHGVSGFRLTSSNCARVLAAESGFTGNTGEWGPLNHGVTVTTSNVMLRRCSLLGSPGHASFEIFSAVPGGNGLNSTASTVECVDCQLTGGAGG